MTTYGKNKTGEPAFAIRGVVEGFYGEPWAHSDRLDMIGFIGQRGMNRFVYAPKDDPFLRSEWTRPYPAAELADLGELVAAGRRVEVDFVYCLSPGLSIRYSDPDDRERVKAKLDAIADLGVVHFGLLLDDIPARLQHPLDIESFASLAHAQSELANDVADHLRECVDGSSLIVCPTEYFGYGNEPYITELGGLLSPDIALFWTGRAICSAQLDVADAQTFRSATGRFPTHWDNYPVNDVAMAPELHVGPYRGRAAALSAYSGGVIANAMELFESSKIAIATIADYLWDPVGYDPEKSWEVALRDVAGDADAPSFRDFADTSRSSCLSEIDAPEVTRAIEEMEFALVTGDAARAAAALAPLAARLCSSAEHLLSHNVVNTRLMNEARPWIEAFKVGSRALAEMAAIIAAGEMDSAGPTRLRPYLDDLRSRRVRIFGDVLNMTLDGICRPHPQSTR